MNACIFCGPTTEKITHEHIYSRWISKKLRQIGVGPFDFEKIDTRGFRRQRFTAKTGELHLKPRVVCKSCNNVWLSTIEEEALATFFFDMVLGNPMNLDADQQAVLTFWLVRLAMVGEYRTKQRTDPTFFTQAEREEFRLVDSVPRDTQIWIARHIGDSRQSSFDAFIGQHYISPPGTHMIGTYAPTRCVYVINGKIARFAFQLMSRRFPFTGPQAEEVTQRLEIAIENWGAYTAQIWPESDGPVVWPPSSDLSDANLKDFFDRFGGKTIQWRHD